MQIIDITPEVRFVQDGVCVTLERRKRIEKGARAGTVTWETVGYYATIKDAAVRLLVAHNDLLDPPELSDVRTLVDSLGEAEARIAHALQVHNDLLLGHNVRGSGLGQVHDDQNDHGGDTSEPHPL